MKKFIFSLVLLSFTLTIFSQKAKIRKKRYKVEYASLPKHKVDAGTYKVDVSGMGSYAIDEEAVNLRGWDKVDEGDADVKVKVKVSGFKMGTAKRKSETKTSTDSKTKKKTTSTVYWYEVNSSGSARMSIWGPTNEYKPMPKKKKQTKKKKSSKKKKAPKKETNRFLKDVDIDDAPVEENSATGAGSAGSYDLGKNYRYSTSKTSSRKKAFAEYENNGANHASDSRESFYNNMGNNVSYKLNDFYGYNRKTEWVVFKRLKSKKHPEYQIFNDATDGIKEIFAQKRFNMNNDQIAGALGPIMEYFESVVKKYSKDDKNHIRVKSAAMFNMAQAYLYLDMPEKTIEIAQTYKRWGKDSDIGESFKDSADRLKHLLEFHGVTGRFYETEENADDVWTEDIGDEPSDEGND